jgi:predicted RNA-binding Zn-ribbon protein involved in translation (DUF1610 family)
MRGHIRRRGDPGSWEYIIDVGMATAQRCEACGKRFWMERKPKTACPKCGGTLSETEERRRKTQAGFANRKECEAALNKVMTAVEERSYVVPSRITVREYLLKEWLPAIKGTVRPTTYASYTTHVEGHILPALGSLQLSRLSAQAINAFYARLLASGRLQGKGSLSPPLYGACTPLCIGPSRMPCAGSASRSIRSMPPIHLEVKANSASSPPGMPSSWRGFSRTSERIASSPSGACSR